MREPVLASNRYDLSKVPEQMDEKYCDRHDLFHVRDAMGDWICPACAVEAVIEDRRA